MNDNDLIHDVLDPIMLEVKVPDVLYKLVEEGVYDYGALSDGIGEVVRSLTISIPGADVPEEAYKLAAQSLL